MEREEQILRGAARGGYQNACDRKVEGVAMEEEITDQRECSQELRENSEVEERRRKMHKTMSQRKALLHVQTQNNNEK